MTAKYIDAPSRLRAGPSRPALRTFKGLRSGSSKVYPSRPALSTCPPNYATVGKIL